MSLILKLDAAKAVTKTPDQLLLHVFPQWVNCATMTREQYEAMFEKDIVAIEFYPTNNGWINSGRHRFTWSLDTVLNSLRRYHFILADNYVEGEFPDVSLHDEDHS